MALDFELPFDERDPEEARGLFEREDLLVVFDPEREFEFEDFDFDDVRRLEPLVDLLLDRERDPLLVAIPLSPGG